MTLLVPTLCVGMLGWTLRVEPICGLGKRRRASRARFHAERGNEGLGRLLGFSLDLPLGAG
jgi:hypothetical protein